MPIRELRKEAIYIVTHAWEFTGSMIDLAWRFLKQHGVGTDESQRM